MKDVATLHDTDALQQTAADHLWMPFSPSKSPEYDQPPILVHGRGSRVTDSTGKQYIDGLAALEAMLVGHGRSELIEAASAQMQAVAFVDVFRYASEPAIRLAGVLADMLPAPLSRVFYTPGGAEAVEVSLKIARQYHLISGQPNRQKVITRAGSFHGCTYGAMEVDGNYWATRNYIYDPSPDAGRIVPPFSCSQCDFGKATRLLACPHAIEQALLTERPETVAAVVVDPAASAIGVSVPPPDYMRELARICQRHGVLLIVDEIITGFGRTGKLFCTDYSGVEPDMVTLSKGLTSGYAPLGAAVVSEKISEALESPADGRFTHGHTFGGHPVSCAVALANLNIILEEGLAERSRVLGEQLLERLRAALQHHRTVWDIRGLGLLAGVELTQDEDGTPFSNPGEVGAMVRQECRANGLITLPLHPGSVMFFAPPLVITSDELDEMVEIFARSLSEVERKLTPRRSSE
jgi:adenosylmethionine-8-amino-7-oxononanoate aminotransferase